MKAKKMPKRLSVCLLILALSITGCLRSSGLIYTPPALEEGWAVTLKLSGGIAGLKRNIHVKSDGSYVVVDERSGKQFTGELSKDDLAELESLLSALHVQALNNPSACADCFEYDLEIETGGKKMVIHTDDITLGDSGAGTLVQFLRKKMDAALQ